MVLAVTLAVTTPALAATPIPGDPAHGGVGDLPGPDPLHVLCAKVASAHAGHLGVGVGLARLGVLDHLEEVLDSTRDASHLRLWSSPTFANKVLLEPHLWGKAHGLGDSPHLLEAGVLYAALAQVGDVGARHDATRRLVDLLAAPPAAVRAAISLQETLESLRYLRATAHPRLRPRWYNPGY